MTLPLLIALACEADLTLTAGAVALALRRRKPGYTVFACGALALAYTAAMLALWGLWFVAPGCVINGCSGQAVPAQVFAYLGAGVAAHWMWMLAVALLARRATKNRQFAHSSG